MASIGPQPKYSVTCAYSREKLRSYDVSVASAAAAAAAAVMRIYFSAPLPRRSKRNVYQRGAHKELAASRA
jgi:hypothetical protein